MEIINIEIQEESRTLRGLQFGTDPLKGVIIMYHGLMDNYEFPLIHQQAVAYANSGYMVFTVDFIGHGKSDGTMLDMTLSKEIIDGQSILNYVVYNFNPHRIILIGHSQGAVIASITAARNNKIINRLVLESPAGHIADTMRRGFATKPVPETYPIFDQYVSREYITELMDMDLYGMFNGYKGKSVFILGAGNDPIVSADRIQKYKEIYKYNEVKSNIIAGAPHDFTGHIPEVIGNVLEYLQRNNTY